MVRLFAIFLFSIGLCAQPPAIVIRGARVVDGTGAPARLATVVIRGTMVEAVAPGAAIPDGARVIDAAGQTLMPGLFDLHTHLSASAVTGLSGDWGKSLKAYLACGVTTVNDYATNGEMFAPLRQLLASGAVLGPRVNMAIRMSTPGGHGTEGGWGDFMTLTAATPEQAHAKTKIALSYKPDVIKVFTDGWRYGMAPNLSSMNLETLSAIVGDAHAAGVKVFTHTVTLARREDGGQRGCGRAGARHRRCGRGRGADRPDEGQGDVLRADACGVRIQGRRCADGTCAGVVGTRRARGTGCRYVDGRGIA